MAGRDGERDVIATSDPTWFQKALEAYRRGERFTLRDDAGVGLSAAALGSGVALIRFVVVLGVVPWREVLIVLTGLGLSVVGIWLILVAVADPEPTSKLGILLAGGVALIFTGGASILYALGVRWKVSVKSTGGNSFTIEPA